MFAASGRHINDIATRPQSPHTHTTQSTLTSDFTIQTLHTHKRSRAKPQNTIAQWKNRKIYIMKIIQSQTECSYIIQSVVLLIIVQTVYTSIL